MPVKRKSPIKRKSPVRRKSPIKRKSPTYFSSLVHPMKNKMYKKIFEECVLKVKKKSPGVNPWAVCHASLRRHRHRKTT